MTVINITGPCIICEKDTIQNTGYVILKDCNALCLTCTQCGVAHICVCEGGNKESQIDKKKYKESTCIVDLGNDSWLFQKVKHYDCNKKPILPLLDFIEKGLKKQSKKS